MMILRRIALFVSALTIISLQFMPVTVLAVDVNEDVCSNPTIENKDKSDQPLVCNDSAGADTAILGQSGILSKVVQVLVYIITAISVIMIIIGGLRYVLSGGDSNGVKGAKDTILYALVGLVVALFAQAIVAFVINKL